MTSNSTRASQYSKLDLVNFEGTGAVATAQWRDVDGPQNHGYVYCIWCPKFPPTISRMRGVAKFKLIQRILWLTTHNSTRTLLMFLCLFFFARQFFSLVPPTPCPCSSSYCLTPPSHKWIRGIFASTRILRHLHILSLCQHEEYR